MADPLSAEARAQALLDHGTYSEHEAQVARDALALAAALSEAEEKLRRYQADDATFRQAVRRHRERIAELEAALVAHHAAGAMDGVLVGDRCPVCAALAATEKQT